MFRNIENTIYKQILFIGIAILVGLIVFGAGGMQLAKFIWSAEDILAATNKILDTPERINYMKFIQFTTMIGTFVFPAIALSLASRSYNFSFLYLNRGVNAQMLIMTIVLVIVSIPIVNALMVWNQGIHLPESMAGIEEMFRDMEAKLGDVTEKFVLTTSISALLINLLVMAVLPAFGEEFFFRAILIKWFNRSMGIHFSILLSAFIFSAIHMQFLGFVPRFFLGIVLGYVFYWSGSLWLPILLHFLNNSMAVISYFLLARGVIHGDPDQMGSIDSTPILLINTLVFGAMMYWFYRNKTVFKP